MFGKISDLAFGGTSAEWRMGQNAEKPNGSRPWAAKHCGWLPGIATLRNSANLHAETGFPPCAVILSPSSP
ncbi:MAG: hypothetical protein ACM3X0_14520 [Bacteroidota bacterium]